MKKDGNWNKIVLGIIVILLISGFTYQHLNSDSSQKPSGKIIEVNGKSMHIRITGDDKQNNETVVLIPGMGDGHLLWSDLQTRLSQYSQVISYDPSGFGFSEGNNRDKSAKTSAEELYYLLQESGVKPPYILVGHSNGGFTARAFEAMYQDLVSGMVLIDSTHEKMVSGNVAATMYRLQGGFYYLMGGLNYIGIPRLVVDLFGTNIVLDGLVLDKEIEAQYIDTYYKSSTYFSIAKQCMGVPKSVKQIEELAHDLGNLSLKILCSVDGVEEDEEEVTGFYNELAATSTNSEVHIIEDSGHYIHLDQEDAVLEGILEIMDVRDE